MPTFAVNEWNANVQISLHFHTEEVMSRLHVKQGEIENEFGFEDEEQDLSSPGSDKAICDPKKGDKTESSEQAGSLHDEKRREEAKRFQDEEVNFMMVSTEEINFERVFRSSHCTQQTFIPRPSSTRISISDFSIPKFTMRLTANQGNPKQLSALLAAKQKKRRVLRPKLEYCVPGKATVAESEQNQSPPSNINI